MIVDSDPEVNPFLQSALVYASYGWAVLPLHPLSKIPATTRGVKDATTDAETIRRWWDENPERNVGIACGAPSNSLVVVDYDGVIPPPPAWGPRPVIVHTPNGGAHHYYYADVPRTYNHAHGEVRSSGSYVVAPPSRLVGGGEYVLKTTRYMPPRAEAHDLPNRVGTEVAPEAVEFEGAPLDTTLALSVLTRHTTYIREGRSGDRSGEEYHIACDLVRSGASNAAIRDFFNAYLSSGTHYAEHRYPERYLALTVGKARAEHEQREDSLMHARVPEATSPAGGWLVQTLADAYVPRPPIEWAVRGIFMLPSLNIVYGAPGSLKSLLMADAALAVAAGEPWLPMLQDAGPGHATTAVPALWVDYDNGARRSAERFAALGKTRGVAAGTPFYYVTMQTPWLDVSNRESVLYLKQVMAETGARFVVIDNLGLVIGDADENSHRMAAVMGNLRWLAEETAACLSIIHHQRKTSVVNARAGEALRGSGSIEAALDLALQVQREARSDSVSLIGTKVRGYDMGEMGAHWSYEVDEEKELTRAAFHGVPITDFSSDSAVYREVRAALKSSQYALSQSELVAEAHKTLEKVGQKRIRTLLAVMVESGEIVAERGASNNALMYRLPAGPEKRSFLI